MAYEHTRKNYAHGIVGRIVQDDDPVNPRIDYEHLCEMTCWHSRYKLGDPHRCADTRDLFEDLLRQVGVVEYCPKCEGDGYVVNAEGDHEDCPACEGEGSMNNADLFAAVQEHYYVRPLYLYDHGGLSISMGAFSCPWDSGQVGWITLRKLDAYAEWSQCDWASVDDWVNHVMKAEVEEYDQYLTGDVWGAVVEDENGDELDACWGLFGLRHAETEMQVMAEDAVRNKTRMLADEAAKTEAENAERLYWAERDVLTEDA